MNNPTTFAHLLARWNVRCGSVPDSVERAGTAGSLVGTVVLRANGWNQPDEARVPQVGTDVKHLGTVVLNTTNEGSNDGG